MPQRRSLLSPPAGQSSPHRHCRVPCGERWSKLEDLLEALPQCEILMPRHRWLAAARSSASVGSAGSHTCRDHESLMSACDESSATPRSESHSLLGGLGRLQATPSQCPRTPPSLLPRADDASRPRAALSDPSKKQATEFNSRSLSLTSHMSTCLLCTGSTASGRAFTASPRFSFLFVVKSLDFPRHWENLRHVYGLPFPSYPSDV